MFLLIFNQVDVVKIETPKGILGRSTTSIDNKTEFALKVTCSLHLRFVMINEMPQFFF
jgi:hypothetical protein